LIQFVVGNGIHDAVIWKDGKIQDLGTVDGDACSRGRGINARGQVVGGSRDCANFLHAFIWEEGGPMLDLNKLIATGVTMAAHRHAAPYLNSVGLWSCIRRPMAS
jgi:probable HAF family extracellular repeat protein